MKHIKLKEFIVRAITILFIFFGFLYYMNFIAKGDTGFISEQNVTIYQAPRPDSKVVTKGQFGEEVTIVPSGMTGHTPYVKIRIERPDKKPMVGYVHNEKLGSYVFPNLDSEQSTLLILCDKDISLKEFVPELKKTLDTKKVAGVYFKRDSISNDHLSDLEHFCYRQRIPWGNVRKLSEDSVSTIEGAMALESTLSPNEKLQDFGILPPVFDIGDGQEEDILDEIDFQFVALSSSPNCLLDGAPMWLDYDASVSSLKLSQEESIYARTLDEDEVSADSYAYAELVNGWDSYIEDAYETAREEAAE